MQTRQDLEMMDTRFILLTDHVLQIRANLNLGNAFGNVILAFVQLRRQRPRRRARHLEHTPSHLTILSRAENMSCFVPPYPPYDPSDKNG